MKTNTSRRFRSFGFQVLLLLSIVSQSLAQGGWKAEEPIAFGVVDDRFARIQFDNKNNTMIPTWDAGSSGNSGGNYAIRPHLGPVGIRLGPSFATYFTVSTDDQGNSLVAYALNGKIFTGFIPVGSSSITHLQNLGNTVGYAAGRIVDVHITSNGLGIVIWLDGTGRPNVAFRASGSDAEFDLVNKSILDTSPSSSAGNVFIARDEDGGAFAVWRRDQQNKQAYYNTSSASFDVQPLNFIIPLGPAPRPGKINSGSLLSMELAKNSHGDTVLGYGIYTSVPGSSVEPFNSISMFYAYRKHGTPLFGQHVGSINPDNIEELYCQVAVLPDGRAVVSWLKQKYITNPCLSGISGPIIGDAQELRSVISDVNGAGWTALANVAIDQRTEFISFPIKLAVADNRVIIGYKKSYKAGQCAPNTLSSGFNLLHALWPENTPSFSSGTTPIIIPGMPGFGNPAPYFDNIAAVGVSNIGTVGVLAAKHTASFNSTPSLFVWESGLEPGVSNSQPTPTSKDGCPDDINKSEAGICGCGFAEIDSNGDKVIDCGAPGGIQVKGGILSNAPFVEPAGEDLTVLMQQFPSFFNTAAGATSRKTKAPKITGVYEVTAVLQGSKLKCSKVKVQSKSNKVKLKKLLSGTYDVSYKMIFNSGNKKIGTTSQSPTSQGTVVSNRVKCAPRKKS